LKKGNVIKNSPPSKQVDWTHLASLFARYRVDNERATVELFEVLQKVLYSFFKVRMTGSSEVEDMTQTTLLKIHFGRNGFNEELSLKTWVFTIANRALIDHWRVGSKDKDNLQEGEQDVENMAIDIINLADLFEINTVLENALNKLKPFERSIVYLYGVEGLSMAEIAKVHATTEGAIKVRAHRAYQELKGYLVVLLLFLTKAVK
jgi:RNA polymerase sigma factor (sigma-70 family)